MYYNQDIFQPIGVFLFTLGGVMICYFACLSYVPWVEDKWITHNHTWEPLEHTIDQMTPIEYEFLGYIGKISRNEFLLNKKYIQF